MRDEKGKWAKGNALQDAGAIEKKEAFKSLLSRFNQHGCIWSGVLEGVPGAEKYGEYLRS